MGQPQRIFDSLAYQIELKSVGFTEKQATVQAERLFDILDNQLLTRQDMHEMEMRLASDIKQVDLNVKDLEMRLSHDIMRLSNDIKQVDLNVKDLELRLSKEIQQLDSKITAIDSKLGLIKHELLTKLGGLTVVLFGLLIGSMKFIH